MARGGRRAPHPVIRRDVRWFSAAILVTCVTVAGLGLAMGFYLDRAPDPAPTPVESASHVAAVPSPVTVAERAPLSAPAVAVAAEPAPTPEPEPPSAVEAPPSEPTPAIASTAAEPSPPASQPATLLAAEQAPPAADNHVAVELAAIEPAAGTTAAGDTLITPMVASIAATVIPPLRLTPAASYWVEYAVFSRERSAQRLRQALAALHLETVVVATHAPDGRRLWRVRSAPLDARAVADAAAVTARQKLAIVPLIHRGMPGGARPVQYWVQFGAFPTKAPAVRLQQVLADNGVKSTVRDARTSSGKSLFLVRSEGFSDRKLAVLVGELGASAAKVSFVLGRSGSVTRQRAPPGTADRAVGSSLPRRIHRPPPGG
jgi:SPOR domain